MKNNFFNKSYKLELIKNNLVSLDQKTILELSYCSSRSARKKISFQDACKLDVLPLGISKVYGKDILSFACSKNCDLELKRKLEFLTNYEVRLLPVDVETLSPAIFKAYKGSEDFLESAKLNLKTEAKFAKPKSENLLFRTNQTNSSEISFLISILDYTIAKKASDLHLIPKEDGSIVKIRINGELYEHQEHICSLEQHNRVINRLKILAKLDTTNKKTPQDGSFTIDVINKNVKVRLSTMPTIFGEKAVLRIQGIGDFYSLEMLALDNYSKKFLDNALQSNEGLIIFCGPTGSGKTTTMYAGLDALSKQNLSLVTVEDPVEIEFRKADQTSICEAQGLTYSKALKSILRQDPDVILIGEIRDKKTAKIVFNAALSGHLILSTVHAGDVFQAIKRLEYLGVENDLIYQTVRLIINQRLVPILCKHCKTIDSANSSLLGFETFQATGCKYCDSTGYGERNIIAEILKCSKDFIVQNEKNLNQKILSEKYPNNYVSLEGNLESFLKLGKIDYKTFQEFSYE